MDSKVKDWINENKEIVYKIFESLHSIPELSTEEFKTSAYINETLKKYGYDTKKSANTGIVSEVDSGNEGPTLGLRADIDALGHIVDGELIARHSCGHDAHTTMVLTSAIVAKELDLVKKGRLKLIFQPSEEQETTSGARTMIKEGVIDDLDYLVGMHLRPINEAKKGQAISALLHGSLTTVVVEVIGVGGHAGRPHQAKNPIDATAHIIQSVNSIWMDPAIPWSAKTTSVISDAANASSIPGSARILIDLRAGTNEVMEELINKVKNAAQRGAMCNGCNAEVEVIPGLAAARVDDEIVDIAETSIIKALGNDGMLGRYRTPGADDFNEFAKARPELKTTYIGLGCDMEGGLHNIDMTFHREALLDGVEIFVNIISELLS